MEHETLTLDFEDYKFHVRSDEGLSAFEEINVALRRWLQWKPVKINQHNPIYSLKN